MAGFPGLDTPEDHDVTTLVKALSGAETRPARSPSAPKPGCSRRPASRPSSAARDRSRRRTSRTNGCRWRNWAAASACSTASATGCARHDPGHRRGPARARPSDRTHAAGHRAPIVPANTGVPYYTRFDSGVPGQHVMVKRGHAWQRAVWRDRGRLPVPPRRPPAGRIADPRLRQCRGLPRLRPGRPDGRRGSWMRTSTGSGSRRS